MEVKKVALPEIDKFVSATRDSVNQHKEFIKSMSKFAIFFVEMVKSECPEFTDRAKQISNLLKGAMDQERIIAAAEERLVEDLNDLSIRYDVIYKFGQRIQKKRVSLVKAKKKIVNIEEVIEIDKVHGSKKVYKLQIDLDKAKIKKDRHSSQLKEMLEQFTEVREKYTLFKINRLQHGFNNLGLTAIEAIKAEGRLLTQLIKNCTLYRDHIDELFEYHRSKMAEQENNENDEEYEEEVAEEDENEEDAAEEEAVNEEAAEADEDESQSSNEEDEE